MTTATFEKFIRYDRETRDYAMYLDGELIGFAHTNHEAEVTLNNVIYDRIIHGDCNTAEEMDGVRCSTCGGEGDCPDCDPTDIPDEPNPTPGGDPPPEVAFPQRAYTRADKQIEQTMQRNRQCPNCSDAHFGWQCPEIRARLFAAPTAETWKGIALGRELCRMKWLSHRGFVTLLSSLSTEHLCMYAESYIAFIRSYNPESDLLIREVLAVWAREIGADRGPAAPVLGEVAA